MAAKRTAFRDLAGEGALRDEYGNQARVNYDLRETTTIEVGHGKPKTAIGGSVAVGAAAAWVIEAEQLELDVEDSRTVSCRVLEQDASAGTIRITGRYKDPS